MTTDFTMPKLGLTMDEGTVVRWLAAEGDRIAAGEVILEVQTDKVTVEVEAPAAGVLETLLVNEGETVPVGTLLAYIRPPDETPLEQPKTTPLARRIAAREGIDLAPATLEPGAHRITAANVQSLARGEPKRSSSPRARKRAREAGIDWHSLRGTGPRGRVIERDVFATVPCASTPPATASGAPPASVRPASGPEVVQGARWEEPTPVQRIAAERTTETFTSTPHFYLTSEVAAEALVEMRERLLPAVQRRAHVRLTFTDLLLKITAATLAEHPRANAFWQEGRIGVHEQIDIGIATASESGLVVPVLRRADRLSLAETARERTRLVEAARTAKLTPDDIAGGTFTLSNLGAHRVDQFQPVLNSSPTGSPVGAQSVILAVGRIAPRPFVINGQVAVTRTLFLTIACDHRVLDGAQAAAFLDGLIALIEEPYELLV